MRLNELLEQTTNLSTKLLQTSEELQEACDLINEGGQLSWTLNPSRLQGRLGSIGKIFGLYQEQELIGTVGLKEITLQGVTGVEMGYLYIKPEKRSLQAYMRLYRTISSIVSEYQFMFSTTNVNNNTINTLMKRSNDVEKAFEAKSPYSSNILNYWYVKGSQLPTEKVIEILRKEYGENLLESFDNSFNIIVTNRDKIPHGFQNYVDNMVNRVPFMEYGEEGSNDFNTVEMRFGRGNPLPSENNLIVVGNKFYSKEGQYSKLKGVVPLLNTYFSASEVGDDFIAKRKIGQRQQGQLINTVPEDEEDYIYQPLVDIKAEYRVVVFFMNGSYHVSGVYRKTGSNVSLTSITSGDIFREASHIAIEACKALGYGVGGADIIMTDSPNITESFIGNTLSAMGRLKGKLDSDAIDGRMALLEVNTLPSMSNPMILTDFLHKIKSVTTVV